MPFEEIESVQSFRKPQSLAGTGGLASLAGFMELRHLGLRGSRFGDLRGTAITPGAKEALVFFLTHKGQPGTAAIVSPLSDLSDPLLYNAITYALGPGWIPPITDKLNASGARALMHFPAPDFVRGVQKKGGLPQDGKLGKNTAAYLDKQLPGWKGRPWQSGQPKSILDAFGTVATTAAAKPTFRPRPKPEPKPEPGPVVEEEPVVVVEPEPVKKKAPVVQAASFFSPTVLIVGGIALAAVAILPGLLKRRPAAAATV